MIKVSMVGHLLADPKFFGNEDDTRQYVRLRVAHNQTRRGEQSMHPMDVVQFGRSAAHAAGRLKKGNQVIIHGRLEASPEKAQSKPDSNGQTYDREQWGIIADPYEGIQFGRGVASAEAAAVGANGAPASDPNEPDF